MPFRLIDQVTSTAAKEVSRQLDRQKRPSSDSIPVSTYREQLKTAQTGLVRQWQERLWQHRQIQVLKAQLAEAKALGSDQIEPLELNLARAMAGLRQQYEQQGTVTERVINSQRQLVDRLGTAAAYSELDNIPLVMLPVRLETRYFAADEDHYELRVRIYPDEIHVDNHQELLSAAEAEMGQQYWQARLADGDEGEATLAVWGYLCQQVGEDRAFQVVTQLDPEGFGRRGDEVSTSTELQPVPEAMIAPDDWADTPKAMALPDRWAIAGYRGDQRILIHWTKPVPPDLPVSPNLSAPLAEDDTLEPDDGIRWMTDFATAESLGMAARIQVNKTVARSMDRLLVFGIDASQTPEESTFELTQLLRSHTHTGLHFASIGTPTNNTRQAKTDYRRPINHRESHQRLLDQDIAVTENAHQTRLARAMGLPVSLFQFLKHRLDDTEGPIDAIYRALWPVTWGEFLQHQVELPVTVPVADWFEQLTRQCVRPQGFLPTLQVGAQPYGILPIVSLNRWQSRSGRDQLFEQRLVNGLRSLQRYWMQDARIPHLFGNADAPLLYNNSQQTLMRILSMSPTTHIQRGKVRQYATDQAADFARTRMQQWWEGLLNTLSRFPVDLSQRIEGVSLKNRDVSLQESTFLMDNPLVSPQADKSQPIPPEENYIAALAQRPGPSRVINHQLPGAQSQAWLYVMLRSAYLLAFSQSKLTEFSKSLKVLQDLPVDTLEALVTNVVDGVSHRVDAWISAIANHRLMEVRHRKDTIHLGGYGWVEGLEPPGEGAKDNGTIVEAADSGGYLHMPSLAQAKTAAILYGANQAQADRTDRNSLYAINLSSEKVRRAKWLLDGLNQGQSLGALLGYWLERQMVEKDLAHLILPLRELAPLPVGNLPAENLATSHGMDGLQIYTHWQSGILQQRLDRSDYFRLTPILNQLHFIQDGLSDLLLAEGVHQATNGNGVLAAAAFDAMADGSSRVNQVEVTATPAVSQQLSCRVGVLLPETTHLSWPGDEHRLRAIAEPRLNAWVAALLGQPDAIHFTATLVSEEETIEVKSFTLADFDLCPLDVVYLSGTRQEAHATGQPILSPLIELLRYFLQLTTEIPITSVTIKPQTGDQTSLTDTLALAQTLREVFIASRPMQPSDLTAVASSPEVTPQSAELAERAKATQQQFTSLQNHLENVLEQSSLQPDYWWQAALLTGPVDPALVDSLTGMVATLTQRQRKAAEQTHPIQQIQALLGQDFQAIAPFSPENPGELATNLANQDSLLEQDYTRPKRWLQDYARVRPNVAPFDLALTLGELLVSQTQLQVAQIPYQPGQIWVGERKPYQGLPQISLVMHTPFELTRLTTGEPLAGLIIDAWSEALPKDTSVTGLAFNYDEPKAQAPQAILMALPPDMDRNWQFEDLESALMETFELIKLRATTQIPRDIQTYLPSLNPPGDLSEFFLDS